MVMGQPHYWPPPPRGVVGVWYCPPSPCGVVGVWYCPPLPPCGVVGVWLYICVYVYIIYRYTYVCM